MQKTHYGNAIKASKERGKNMSRASEWTAEEIEKLKISFLKGQKMKITARELGRSHTALNKALSRFGIRPLRKIEGIKPKSYLTCGSHNLGNQPFAHSYPALSSGGARSLLKGSALSFDSTTDTSFKLRSGLQKNEQRWVSLNKIITYLERQGHCITTKNARQGCYEVDKKPATATYLLLLANRLRVEENKPIFMVSEVTW